MKKHIGFLIMNFENGGGTERVTSVIASELAKRDYKVTVISCQKGEKSHFDIDDSIQLCSLHGEEVKNSLSRKMVVLKRLKKVVKESRIDIMIAVDVALYIYLWPLRISGECKCIAWEHFNYYIANNRLVRFARKLAAKDADCVVVLGKKDLQNYKEHYKKIKNITYIYNPIAVSTEGNADICSRRVVAAGRLTAQKGFDRLIQIWSIVEKQMPEWKLDIFGDGPLREKLQKQIDESGVNNITLCGYSSNIEMEFLHSSIFALTSRYEGFVLVLLEAMAKGLPCISFACKEGPEEIIDDGVNGFLIEQGNIELFAEKLLVLMKDDKLRKDFSQMTRMNLERHNLDKIMEKWELVLD